MPPNTPLNLHGELYEIVKRDQKEFRKPKHITPVLFLVPNSRTLEFESYYSYMP